MRFMVIRKTDQDTEAGVLPAAGMLEAMEGFEEQLQVAGIHCAGMALHPSEQAVRVNFHDGSISIYEGPFSEENELVAGFSMMEAASKQELIEALERWPAQPHDMTLEVRGGGCPGGLEGIGLKKSVVNVGQNQVHKRFLVLLKANPLAETGAIPSDQVLAAMAKRNEEGIRAGRLLAAEGLQVTASGSRLKFAGGKPFVLDGPFSETKELIAGYWLLQEESIADAIDWVKTYPYPFIEDAQVEIRQVQQEAEKAAALIPGAATSADVAADLPA
ncbi:YciI family protein [Undibacterium terreum]|uniref:YCII-related domain-containing protein n=1 Tax=Undibacterium terreum TaxID=1224302 RepID=A0A916UDT9_9BURK|nr:YciI family protein [Undibacterium terreum]GGC67360.1 hypothetical protein GCM10011396_12950 [Undibacterium terreum]